MAIFGLDFCFVLCLESGVKGVIIMLEGLSGKVGIIVLQKKFL